MFIIDQVTRLLACLEIDIFRGLRKCVYENWTVFKIQNRPREANIK